MRLTMNIFIALLIVGVSSLNAQGRGNGKHAQSGVAGQDAKTAVAVSVSIGKNDERIIHEWFSQPANTKGLPPGLAKREQLPPGLQKQLARNGQLPPGLQKKIQPVPASLEARLTRLPEGRRRIIINGSVILARPAEEPDSRYGRRLLGTARPSAQRCQARSGCIPDGLVSRDGQ
jgi:hypothetical protein